MAFDIERRESTIFFRGQLDRSQAVRPACAVLHQVVIDRGYRDVVLDFSECDAATEAFILPMLPIVARYRKSDGVDFEAKLPHSNDLYRLFNNANWAHFIDPDQFAASDLSDEHIPAQQHHTETEMQLILEQVLEFFIRQPGIGPSVLVALEWALGEVMDNVLVHAQSSVGGFIQATTYVSGPEFIVADAGIGIPASLGRQDHQAAVIEAIKEGGTRDKHTNAGNGLFGTYQLGSMSNGQFELISQNALLYHDRRLDRPITRPHHVPYAGTSVRCRIGSADPEPLRRALEIGGRTGLPVYNYVERIFETEVGELVFRVKERAARDVNSRRSGVRVRRQIENLLAEEDHVVIDFDGVEVISSSFADEVFGRLFVELGPVTFASRVPLRNTNATVRGLIDRAIVQRTQLSRTE